MKFIEKVLPRWRSWRSVFKLSSQPDSRLLGRRGEAVAARFLRRNRYKILYRNFRPRRGGEIDLVCRDLTCNTLVFVEVKTRTSTAHGNPADAVDREKRRRLSRGALEWLRLLDHPDILFRFDIVEVVVDDGKLHCHLIRNAFQLSRPYLY